mgnify:CR=1 FL=1
MINFKKYGKRCLSLFVENDDINAGSTDIC